MPLTAKGERIMAALKKKYGDHGESVFYAMKNSGKITGVDRATVIDLGTVRVHVHRGRDEAPFDESKHHRSQGGQFGPGGGGGGSGEQTERRGISGKVDRARAAVSEARAFVKGKSAAEVISTIAADHKFKHKAKEGLSFALQSLVSHATGLDQSTWQFNEQLIDHTVQHFGLLVGYSKVRSRDVLKSAIEGLRSVRKKLTRDAEESGDDVDTLLEALLEALDRVDTEDKTEDEAPFVESEHPRKEDGKFAAKGAGGESSEGGGETIPPTYVKLGYQSGGSPKENYHKTVGKVLNEPAKGGTTYRAFLGFLIKGAKQHEGDAHLPGLKAKLIDAWKKEADNLTKAGKADEAAKILKKLGEVGVVPPPPKQETKPEGGGAIPPSYVKLGYETGGTPKENYHKTVAKVVKEPAKVGTTYRAFLGFLINGAKEHGGGESLPALKAKLVEAWRKQAEIFKKAGKTDEAAKIEKKLGDIPEQTKPKAEPKPEPTPKPKSEPAWTKTPKGMAAAKVAKDLGFPLDKMDFSSEKRTFVLNGKNYGTGGLAHLHTGRITIFPGNMSESGVTGVTAHEIGHQKYEGASNAYGSAMMEAAKDPSTTPDDKKAILNGDKLREPLASKYPLVNEWIDTFGDRERLAETDGVSDYSAEYWKGYAKGEISFHIAVHETLAEMTRYKYKTGIFPAHRGPGGEDWRWRRAYKLVDRLWNEG